MRSMPSCRKLVINRGCRVGPRNRVSREEVLSQDPMQVCRGRWEKSNNRTGLMPKDLAAIDRHNPHPIRSFAAFTENNTLYQRSFFSNNMLSHLLTVPRKVGIGQRLRLYGRSPWFSISHHNAATIRGFAGKSDQEPVDEKHRLVSIRFYRILQRICQNFPVENKSGAILLQPSLAPDGWGRHMVYKPPSPTLLEELHRLFYVMMEEEIDNESPAGSSSIDDWYHELAGSLHENPLPPMTSLTCWTTKEQLQEAIRSAFRVRYDMGPENSSNLQRLSIRAVQLLQEQQLMWSQSSSATTEGVRVTATSRCIGVASPTAILPTGGSILESKYQFTYRIRVENVSDQSVQLLGRFWKISEVLENGEIDDSKQPVVVDSPATGAVGHLPVLQPGQVFEYMSGTDLVNTHGVMQGHFYMARVPPKTPSARSGDHVEALNVGDKFEVAVAPFPLVATTAYM